MAANDFLKRLAIFLVRIYQVLFSRLLGGCNCRFEPSCSQYMIEAIEKKGLIHGIYLGSKRLLSCHPFSKKSGFDPVK